MNSTRFSSPPCLTVAVVGTLLLSGCGTAWHRDKVEREMEAIIEAKETEALGAPTGFSIDTRFSDRDPREIDPDELLSERFAEVRREIGLTDALALAVTHSREYQTRKENLYLAALEFSRQRHEFRPRYFGGAEVSAERTPDGERTGRVTGQAGVEQVLNTGARVGVTLTNDIFEFLTGDPRRTATTALSLNLVQPLLRGAGSGIVQENLTQAERNVIYEIRGFAHFQQTFAVRIASSYYRILQRKDAVRNEFNSYQNLIRARERAEALARDRLPEFQADQARQDELRARNRYILAVEAYQNNLDQFKLELGLPLGHSLILDDQPLRDLEEAGLLPLFYDETRAIQTAVASRLDLLNEIDRFEDALRRIDVAANQLKMDVNLIGRASLASDPPADYTSFDLNNYRASVGLGVNLPLDRLRERNAYRAALIQFERQIRTLSLSLDQVRNEIRQSLRTLEQARQTFLIQQRAVEIADRRVESSTLLLQAGRAEVRDLLEAEAAQLQARNSLTQALIDYHIARYEMLRNLGVLEADEEGLWIRDILIPDEDPSEAPPPRSGLEGPVITPDELFTH